MLETALTLLAVKAKTVALVAGTAVITAGAVGGGAVALQSVSSDAPIAAPAAAVATATPTATIGIGKKGRGKGAERRSDTATAVLTDEDAAPAVTFTCDPSKNHGQNVSAYVHSLPQGPGRGKLVSQAAQSDCGKDTDTEDAAELEAAEPAPAAKPAKPIKAAKPGKPAKSARSGSTEPAGADRKADASDAPGEADAPDAPEAADEADAPDAADETDAPDGAGSDTRRGSPDHGGKDAGQRKGKH